MASLGNYSNFKSGLQFNNRTFKKVGLHQVPHIFFEAQVLYRIKVIRVI